MDLEIEIGIP